MSEFIVMEFIQDIMLRKYPLISKEELDISFRYIEFGDLNLKVGVDYKEGGRSETKLHINIKYDLLKDIPLQRLLELGRLEFEECLDSFEFGFVPKESKVYWEEPVLERYVWSLPEYYAYREKAVF